MKDLEVFLPYVMPFVQGCPQPTAISAIRQACMRFCEATRSWRYEDEFDVSSAECESFVCVPDGAELFEIETIRFDGRDLESQSLSFLNNVDKRWRSRDREETGSPKYYTQVNMDSLMIAPRSNGRLHVDVFLKPAEHCEQVPDYIANKFRAAIAKGAMGELMMAPGKPYSQPQLAGAHQAAFQQVLDRNYNLNIRGQQRAPTRTRAVHF